MWFFILSILLSTTQILHGSEDSQLAIKELHYEISKVAREVQELYVEPDTAQMELDDKTKKALEEYIEMDISSGLPEQIELLDLKDKADDVKTSEETRKAVLDGLDYLGNVKEMKSDEKQLSDIVIQQEETKEASIRFDKGNFKNLLKDWEMGYGDMLSVGLLVKTSKKEKKQLDDALEHLERVLDYLMKVYFDLFEEFHRIDIADYIWSKLLEVMKNDVAEGTDKTKEIRKLKEDFDLSQKIMSVKAEIEVMEELRDSAVVQKILDFMEKIKASFESIKGLGMDHSEWKITYFSQKWVPIQNYFKNLKVPSGDLTESLTKIEDCLQKYDFSMDFLTEEAESLKLEEAFKDVRAKIDIYSSMRRDVDKFTMLDDIIHDMRRWSRTEEKNWDRFAEIMKEFEINKDMNIILKAPKLVEMVTEIHEAFNKLDTVSIKTVTESITSKLSKIKEFLNCYSSLKIVPSEVKSLMDRPKKVWNFDARPLESVVEVVYLFKEVHRFLDKKEYPIPIDGFPLTKEEVTGISDGLGILKAILDYQKLWTEIPQSFSSSSWNLEIHLDLSNIQFPSDIDSTINSYSTEYQGPKQRRILKVLENVKDFSQFKLKLGKMNEAVGKWKNWKKEQNPVDETVDGEFVDCFESFCELNLPKDIPEEPVKQTEL